MDVLRIRGGHKFKLKYGPKKEIITLKSPTLVAFAPSISRVKPKLLVKEGDIVHLGQPIVYDKKDPRIQFCAPASGMVKEIRYGPRRVLEAVVIAIDSDKENKLSAKKTYNLLDINSLKRKDVEDILCDNGLFAYLKCFPSWDIAPLSEDKDGQKDDTIIRSIHINLIRTESHWPDPLIAIKDNEDKVIAGIKALEKISSDVRIYVPKGAKISAAIKDAAKVIYTDVKYPAENIGVQAWYDAPLKKNEVVIGADAELTMDIGHVLLHGKKRIHRTYAISGDASKDPKHYLGRVGMACGELAQDRLDVNNTIRLIAGGLFCGKKIRFQDYLGENEYSLMAMHEDKKRIPFVFFRLGKDRLTLSRTWLAGFNTDEERAASTNNNGEERACIQCGYCIDICPVALMPNLIMKASVVDEIERMEELDIHDCVDCGLCTFVCPSKIELGESIENGKKLIEKEG